MRFQKFLHNQEALRSIATETIEERCRVAYEDSASQVVRGHACHGHGGRGSEFRQRQEYRSYSEVSWSQNESRTFIVEA